MNKKLILQLSLFGLAMAIATVYWIPSHIEPGFWLVIFILCAIVIAKNCSQKYFLHGFFVSLVNSVWITAAHILLFETYISTHSGEAEMLENLPMPEAPRLMMLITGPLIGIISGVVLGLFALLASRFVK